MVVREKMVMKILILLIGCLACASCSVIRLSNEQTQSRFSAIVPAWPWQDSATIISKMQMVAKTNTFEGSLSDLTQQQKTSTNTIDLIQAIVSSAVKAATKP